MIWNNEYISVNSLKASWINWMEVNLIWTKLNVKWINLVVLNKHWLLFDCWLILYNSLSVNESELAKLEAMKLKVNKFE